MRVILSKVGMVRIIIITVLGVCAVGAVMLVVHAQQASSQELYDEEYD